MQIETGEMHPTFWSKIEKLNNSSYWTYVKGNIPSTRYVILFNLYTSNRISFSQSLYNSKEECFKECEELDILYKDHPLPITKEEFNNKRTFKSSYNLKVVYDYSNGRSWWGYIVLDFELKQIIRIGGHGFKTVKTFQINSHKVYNGVYYMKGANIPECRDYFFRDVDIVPDNYKWDNGEYEGWLQFKWDDGKNAIDYIEPSKHKKENIKEFTYDIETETLEDFPKADDYDSEIIENKFANIIDKETQKRLIEKYGW